MSEKGKSNEEESEKHEEPSTSREIDPELDIRSEKFNPLKALLSPQTIIPYPNAPTLDNIAIFESKLKKRALKQSEKNVKSHEKQTHTAQPSTSSSYIQDELTLATRRFLPHQGKLVCAFAIHNI